MPETSMLMPRKTRERIIIDGVIVLDLF
jgi:hypothetical protein